MTREIIKAVTNCSDAIGKTLGPISQAMESQQQADQAIGEIIARLGEIDVLFGAAKQHLAATKGPISTAVEHAKEAWDHVAELGLEASSHEGARFLNEALPEMIKGFEDMLGETDGDIGHLRKHVDCFQGERRELVDYMGISDVIGEAYDAQRWIVLQMLDGSQRYTDHLQQPME